MGLDLRRAVDVDLRPAARVSRDDDLVGRPAVEVGDGHVHAAPEIGSEWVESPNQRRSGLVRRRSIVDEHDADTAWAGADDQIGDTVAGDVATRRAQAAGEAGARERIEVESPLVVEELVLDSSDVGLRTGLGDNDAGEAEATLVEGRSLERRVGDEGRVPLPDAGAGALAVHSFQFGNS